MPHVYGIAGDAQKHLEAAEGIARDVAAAHAADVDAKGRFPSEAISALGAKKLLGLCVPSAQGGLAQGPRTFVAISEELGRVCGSTAMVFVMHVTAAQAIAASTTLASRRAILEDIAAGKHLTTLSLSEKGSRSNFWAPVSKLVEKDGGWTTNAAKSWITAAHHADSYVSSGQRPGAASPLESTAYLVRPKGNTSVRDGGAFQGLGLRGNDSAPMTFEGLQILSGDLVSAQGEGAKTKLEVVLPWFAIGTSAMSIGLCRAALEGTIAHVQNATLEHAGQKLRDLPNLRARIAEMAVRTEQARSLLARTLAEIEAPTPMTPLFVLQTRLASLQAAVDVTDLAMKTCGGAAFSKHLPLERVFRDARAGWVMAPTTDHLLDFSGKALTGLPLF